MKQQNGIRHKKMKLIRQLEQRLKGKQYSPIDFKICRGWVERFLRFHKDITCEWRHPNEMGRQDFSLYFAG